MVHFAIFAKYWETGKVKTRLAKRVGSESARDVYELFVRHLVDKFESFGDSRTLVYSPPDSASLFRKAVSDNWGLEPQSSGNLGQRMHAFFQSHGTSTEIKNVLVGADTPDLPTEYVNRAVQLLDEVPVVIGPSGDGGYYLIAIKGQVVDIFGDIPWSTDTVLANTLDKLARLRVCHELLPEMRDVDEFEDLRRLVKNLGRPNQDLGNQSLLKKIELLELLNA